MLLALVLTLLAIVAVPSRADTASDFQAAQGRLQQLQEESDKAVDAYNAAASQLDLVDARINDVEVRLRQLNGYVKDDRELIRRQAIATYKYGGTALTQIGVLSDSRSLAAYGRATKYLKAVEQRSLDSLSTFAATQTALDTMTARLRSAQTDKKALLDQLSVRRTQVEASIKQQQVLIDQYKTQLQQQAASDAAAAQKLIATPGAIPPANNALAQGAIDFAKAQLGKPYVYAAAGPDSYDCSGLVMKAYESVGVSLPHYSGAIHDMLPSVPTPEPGDIAWHPGHVALYIGAGWDIEAPQTGDVVRYKPVANRFQAFLRVGGNTQGTGPQASPTTSPTASPTTAAH